ncbi:MAG: hypothetical protein MHM6MM_000232 [Cercozoa sp. M6MM]
MQQENWQDSFSSSNLPSDETGSEISASESNSGFASPGDEKDTARVPSIRLRSARPPSARSPRNSRDSPISPLSGQSHRDGAKSAESSRLPQLYNPAEYENLQVSPNVARLFAHISTYKPETLDLPTELTPFAPAFVPCVGAIDNFVKPARPDGKADFLGLKVLDEPSALSSDAGALELQLRQLGQRVPGRHARVRSISAATRQVHKVDAWIRSVKQVQRRKAPEKYAYSQEMPPLDELLQVLPSQVEDALKSDEAVQASEVPDAFGMSTSEVLQLACAMLDIPFHANKPVDSLHMLFSLYVELRAQHERSSVLK